MRTKQKKLPFVLFLTVYCCSPLLMAAEATSKNTSPQGIGVEHWLTAFLGLAVVLGLILGLAWFVRRFGGVSAGGKQHIKMISVLPVGTRERIALIEVGGQQLLVGITTQNISLLNRFDGQVVAPEQAGSDFASRLQSFLTAKSVDNVDNTEPMKEAHTKQGASESP